MAEYCLEHNSNFIFVCLPTSHPTLYESPSFLDANGEVKTTSQWLKNPSGRFVVEYTENISKYFYIQANLKSLLIKGINTLMLIKKYLKILIIVLMTNLFILVLNYPVSSQTPNSICSNPDRCVLLDEQELFEIKVEAGGYTPEERADIISENLRIKS